MPERMPADPDAQFNDAYERHWTSVFRFALAWTNDWAAAEDLAQDAFIRMWSKRSTLDWDKPTLPWLMTTTHNLATDRFRKLRRTFAFHRSDGIGLESDALVRWLDVRDAMTSLTPMQRAALVLTAVVGLDTDTVGAMLGTSPGAVRAAVSRARDTLRGSDA